MASEVAIGIEEVGIGRVRIQFYGFEEFSLCPGKIKLIMRQFHAQGSMRFGQRRIERQSFGGRHFGLRKTFLGRIGAHNVADVVGVGKADVCQGEIRILGNRLLKIPDTLLNSSWISLVPVETAFQVQIVGLRINRAHFGEIDHLLRREITLHLSRNGRSQLVLNLQHIMLARR